jgi:DNA-binding beta-propeller fold protein YncE
MNQTARVWKALVTIICLAGVAAASANAQKRTNKPLQLLKTIALPGFTGDFDHFAIDEKRNRLFLAGEDHKSVEVFDVKTGRRLKSISGFGTPHSIFYLSDEDHILVTDSEKGQLEILRGADYALIAHVDGLAGADSARLDSPAHILYVVTGGKDVSLDYSFLVAIDLNNNKKIGELRFESRHVEAFALEPDTSRLFINITDKGEVAVLDRKTMQVTARWPIGIAAENSPMAYDAAHRRILLVCRKPGMFVALDADSGKVVAHLPAAGRSDDIAFDPASGRIYVPGGDGHISVFHQDSADKYTLVANVLSAQGAKTSLLVPSLNRYFVAVSPGETKALAKLLIFETMP